MRGTFIIGLLYSLASTLKPLQMRPVVPTLNASFQIPVWHSWRNVSKPVILRNLIKIKDNEFVNLKLHQIHYCRVVSLIFAYLVNLISTPTFRVYYFCTYFSCVLSLYITACTPLTFINNINNPNIYLNVNSKANSDWLICDFRPVYRTRPSLSPQVGWRKLPH